MSDEKKFNYKPQFFFEILKAVSLLWLGTKVNPEKFSNQGAIICSTLWDKGLCGCLQGLISQLRFPLPSPNCTESSQGQQYPADIIPPYNLTNCPHYPYPPSLQPKAGYLEFWRPCHITFFLYNKENYNSDLFIYLIGDTSILNNLVHFIKKTNIYYILDFLLKITLLVCCLFTCCCFIRVC